MSKYTPLEKFLSEKGFDRIRMTFNEIESVIDDRLPASARKHQAWWSNNPSNNVMTSAWIGAGYRTAEVSLGGEKVTFVRNREFPKPAEDRGGPVLSGRLSKPVEETPISTGKLLEFGEANAIVHEIRSELDGPAKSFGRKFWAMMKYLGPQAFATGNEVDSIVYSDRYLKSPLSMYLALSGDE